MSRYTTELRYLSEWTDKQLGLGDYPIYDEAYRSKLNEKIRNHYAFHEIGFETPKMFAMRVKSRMAIIMPYYNDLYKSTLNQFNPFLTMDYTVDFNGNEISSTGKTDSKVSKDTGSHEKSDTFESVKNGGSDSTEISDSSSVSKSTKHDDFDTTTDKREDVFSKEGGHMNVKSGEQDNVRSGSEKNQNTSGNVYKHGLSIDSETPEGFVTTDSIEKDTWASGARKYRERTEQETPDNSTKTYNNVKDTTTFKNVTDDFTYKPETKDVSNYDRVHTHNENDSDDKNNIKNLLNRLYEVENFEYGKNNGQSKSKDLVERVEELITEIDNMSTSGNKSHYKGFNGKTMSEMLKEFRESILNIDMMIIEELAPLFITVLN